MKIVNVAKAVIEKPDGSILQLKRSDTDLRRGGTWDFPGGGADCGESHLQAVIREIYEEAGIKVGQLTLVYCATELHAEGQESVNRSLFFAQISDEAATLINLSSEHDEYKWTSKQQALIDFPHPFYSLGLKYALDNQLL